MSMSDIKRDARLAIHEAMSEPCYCTFGVTRIPSPEQIEAAMPLSTRFATKLRTISPERDGVSILEGVERLIFIKSQLSPLDLRLENGMKITVPGYQLAFYLEQPLDADGPEEVLWTVVRAPFVADQ